MNLLTQLVVVTMVNTIQYNTIQYNTIQYNTIQYNTIQYSLLLSVHIRGNMRHIQEIFTNTYYRGMNKQSVSNRVLVCFVGKCRDILKLITIKEIMIILKQEQTCFP